MRAALLKNYGQPLSVEEISDPIPGPGQVVIEVCASGVCHSGLHLASGEWERFWPWPYRRDLFRGVRLTW